MAIPATPTAFTFTNNTTHWTLSVTLADALATHLIFGLLSDGSNEFFAYSNPQLSTMGNPSAGVYTIDYVLDGDELILPWNVRAEDKSTFDASDYLVGYAYPVTTVPEAPIAFDLVYYPDYPTKLWASITAGDHTHTGFYIRRYYNNGTSTDWHLVCTIDSFDSVIPSQDFTSELSDDHRVTAFNSFGESAYLGWSNTPATATPTNLQFTRDNQNVTVTWDGTLESGDSWKVKLIDPAGYSDTITTVSANTETLLTGRWIDREVRVYPTNTPANEASLTITKDIPAHTAPTNLVAFFDYVLSETVIQLRVQFTCEWLQLAVNENYSNYSGIAYYSLSGDNSNTLTGLTALGNNEFEIVGWVDRLFDDDQYLVTVELSTDQDTAPLPSHVSTSILPSELTALVLNHHFQKNYTPIGDLLYDTDAVWFTMTRSDGILIAEFESKIDDSDWMPLLTVDGSPESDVGLHYDHQYGTESSTYVQSADYLGLNILDHTHFYRYSDGYLHETLSGSYPDNPYFPPRNIQNHTIQVRGRVVGETDWIVSNTVESPLRSVWYLPVGVTYQPSERTVTEYRHLSAYGIQADLSYPKVKINGFKELDEGWAYQYSDSMSPSYRWPYVLGKTKQLVFTIDEGISGYDLTNLQTGPQDWVATASSELTVPGGVSAAGLSISGRTYNVTDPYNDTDAVFWRSANTYDRYGSPIGSPEWWQCDFGETLSIIGFYYRGLSEFDNMLVYGSLTGEFSGEETLVQRASYLMDYTYVFHKAVTLRYLRIVFNRTSYLVEHQSNLLYTYSAKIFTISFYVGAEIINPDWVDIVTPDWSIHWLSAIQRELLDGQPHKIQFKTIVRNPDDSIWTTAESALMTVTLPHRDDIKIRGTHLDISRTA